MSGGLPTALDRALSGRRPSDDEARLLTEFDDLSALMAVAAALRDRGHGSVVSFSRKVFIPVTRLCRDVCHYCTFVQPPSRLASPFLSRNEVLALARAGAAAGCKEALFTLGDKPELRYRTARAYLDSQGHGSTLSYVTELCQLVLTETGLLPHVNAGTMSPAELAELRAVSVSQGIMLESASERLSQKGGPHYRSPDKVPAVRLKTIEEAGAQRIPFTSGILIGIGETRRERIDSLLALRRLHERHGHIQEVIIQNFRAKTGTAMQNCVEPTLEDHLWTIAVARILLGPQANIQAPPNLRPADLARLIQAGINDWGGISPVTPDHVNPEAPWPAERTLAEATAAEGKCLTERLAIYPDYAVDAARWLDPALQRHTLEKMDSLGFARDDAWISGQSTHVPRTTARSPMLDGEIDALLRKSRDGADLSENEIACLFSARGRAFAQVCEAADELRRHVTGDTVSYVVNRNINYTNVCSYRCQFCAFSKGKTSDRLRGRPYDLALDEIVRRAREAWDRGATEVCMQGGIHPDYTGQTYLDICSAVKVEVPGLHIHAFSPLEVSHGAATLGIGVRDFLKKLKKAGLGTLPGTAAEILDDGVRAVICPDKVSTVEWLDVMRAAHAVGLKTTATIMFGHVDQPVHWARHLRRVRDLQVATGGFTEFVPLPFVPMEAPIFLKGRSRKGPTFREAVLMHAVARLVLHPHITNIQTSWVKMGSEGAAICLNAGANDLGGTLMNESITRAAGAVHGQEMRPEAMDRLAASIGRRARQRSTLYDAAAAIQSRQSYAAPPLLEPVHTPWVPSRISS